MSRYSHEETQRDTHTKQCSASVTCGHVFQGLLKVALENARLQEKQLQQERRELKMELYREREMRESLERQLTSELRSRGRALRCNTCIGKLKNHPVPFDVYTWNFSFSHLATIQRRLKKEKKAKRRLQEALEYESKRRGQIEQALQQATSSDPLTHGETHSLTHTHSGL